MKTSVPLRTRGRLCGALLAAATLLGAVSAGAVDVFFDDPSGFGLSPESASAADVAGIDVVAIDSLDLAENLNIFRNFDQASVLIGPPATATSDWSVQNDRGEDLAELYLVFARPLENSITVGGQKQVVDYAETDVGLALRNDVGSYDWVIFEVPAGGDLYYYPAVSLGSLGDGQTTASPFQVNYLLENPQIFLDVEDFELGIPQWQILAVFVPVPEPSTALLLAVGMSALVAGRRRRP